MIDKINYIYSRLDKIKFPPFLANGKEHNIGYCTIDSFSSGVLSLSNKYTGKFKCNYHLIDEKTDIGCYLTDSQFNKSTDIFIHGQFLSGEFDEKQMSFMLQDGGYKCNLGVIEIYTAASVGGFLQYKDDIIF